MNIFSMFSNSMRVASKINSAAHGTKPVEAEALINELCDAGRAQSDAPLASTSNAAFKGPVPYPS